MVTRPSNPVAGSGGMPWRGVYQQGIPQRVGDARSVEAWTTPTRCANSSPRASEGDARSGRAAERAEPPGARPAAHRGRDARRRQRRVLLAARARRARRRVRGVLHAVAGPCCSTTPSASTSSTWRGPRTPRRSRRSVAARRMHDVRPGLQFVLDAITGGAAFVRNGRLDILASNALGPGVYSDLYASATARRPMNLARFCFLDPERADRFYPDWGARGRPDRRDPADRERAATRTTRTCRISIGELSTRSDEFRTRWGAHDVRRHATGHQALRPPRRRPARPRLRGRRPDRRPRPQPADLHRRARLGDRRRARLLASLAVTAEREHAGAPQEDRRP